MLRRLKNLLIRSAIVCYAIVGLFGQGLHSLPGCNHDFCCDEDQCGASGDSHGPVGSDSIVSAESTANHSGHDHANCPICQFQAQGQILTMPLNLGWVFQRATYRCDEKPLVAVIDPRQPYMSRVPPLV